jgi:hypothetical protein
MTMTSTRFPAGSFAYSRPHDMLVTILNWKAGKATVTRALFPDGKPLEGFVLETDLKTLKECEEEAQKEGLKTPPARSLPEIVRDLNALIASFARRPA